METAGKGNTIVKVLITGHQGYIGPVLAKHLSASQPSWEMSGMDLGFFTKYLTGNDPSSYFVQEVRKDIRDIEASDLEGVDAVVHLAAVSNDPIGNGFEEATRQINELGSIRLAELCRDAGVSRFVFASSCSMYGAGSDVPRKENDALNPLTAYARSKVATEKALALLAGGKMKVTCLRFATACGASQRLRLDLVMNDFVASAVHAGKIVVLSDGTPWRPLIHTEDMSRAIEWALVRDGDDFVAVNAGSNDWTWQMGELARDVARVLGDVEVDINEKAQSDKRSYRVDFSLFENLAPDHQPGKSFEEAVMELRDQVSKLNFGDKTFRESMYIRLNVLQNLKAQGTISNNLQLLKQ